MERKEIERLVDGLTAEQVSHLVFDLIDVLYGVGAPKDMGADQLAAVVGVLDDHGLVPEEAEDA
jgi:hypothetical protein